MLHCHAIVLHRTAYNDNYFIAHVYALEYGRMGVLVPNKRRGNSSARNSFAPLAELELELNPSKSGALYRLKQVSRTHTCQRLQADPSKCTQAIFISELLYRVLTHSEADEALYAFVSESIAVLETLEYGVANFYLSFTYHLLALLAVAPDVRRPRDYEPSMWFDLVESCYTHYPVDARYALPPEVAKLLPLLPHLRYERLARFTLNREQRAYILDWMLMYYRLHLPDFAPIRSLEILRANGSCHTSRIEPYRGRR